MKETTFILLVLCSSAFCLGQDQQSNSPRPGSESSAEPQESSPELAAIRAGSEAFVAAFNQGDAKAIAALWTEDGEYIDDRGRRYAGREAIEKGYAEFFTGNPGAAIQIAIDSLRLVSPNTAIEDGLASVKAGSGVAGGASRYTVVHVKDNGKWWMASVRDTAIETPAAVRSAADLHWLIGTWVAEEHGVQTESVCRWAVDGRFIERRYTTTQLDGTKTSGVQWIGWNAQGGHVQSWDFSPDGGHAVGVWSPTEGGWQAKVAGTTGDGISTTAVNRLTRLDDNAYAWQSVRRFLGDVPLPDTNEVVIKRRPAE
ncbi:MAG: SgcJ/EcaC family oxidoreductase [Pirellulaceae bacterium]|nr:SgcJ/EcaC family oxidoreductase [Pirellulaceae bacterium]